MLKAEETATSAPVRALRAPGSEGTRALVGHRVSQDLASALGQFKDEKVGLRQLSRKMGIHAKTLRRLLQCEHAPGYVTLYKIYRVITGASDDTALLDQVPNLIREQLLRGNPKRPESGVIFRGDLEREVIRDQTFAELYFAAGAGTLTQEEIVALYGQRGMQTVRKMLSLGVLRESAPLRYVLGPTRINLSSEGIKRACASLLETFVDPARTDEPGENHIAVYAEGLSPEAYQEWLKIDEEAYRKKVELTRNPASLGSIRAFTMNMTDQFRMRDEK